jgi:hypothetical protein
MEDINYAKKMKRNDEDAGIEYYRSPLKTLKMHFLKRIFHYLTIYMNPTK